MYVQPTTLLARGSRYTNTFRFPLPPLLQCALYICMFDQDEDFRTYFAHEFRAVTCM